MRKKFIAGNWKMNKTSEDAKKYLEDFNIYVKDINDVDIVLCGPFTALCRMRKEIGQNIKIGAQNMYFEDKGAYTGEISPIMIKEFCDYVIIGHSERRTYFAEDNATINKKIKKALEHGLKVIFCLGEKLEQREKKQTKQVVETQLREGLADVTPEQVKNIVIAYEPVWAIGTGQTATPQQAEEIHAYLRELIGVIYSVNVAEEIRIIYGGSVKPNNAREIISMPNIDGALPGGASLDPESFSGIIKASLQ